MMMHWGPLGLIVVLILVVLIIYYFVLLVRAIIEMLQYNVHSVLLTFAFIALIPLPPTLVMGVMILIIWRHHKKEILAGQGRTQ